jgi:cysteine synthase A
MPGAVKKAEELAAADPRYFIPQQFENPANPAIHRATTAEEIWADTDGQVDIFVAGVGTGGTVTGVGEVLKERSPGVRWSPSSPPPARCSPAASAAPPDPGHRRRLRAGHPQHRVYDEIVQVPNDAALDTARRLARRKACWSASRPAPPCGRPCRWPNAPRTPASWSW